MDAVQRAKNELAVANRIMAHLGAFAEEGHIALRHPGDPGRFFLAAAVNTAFVTPDDIHDFDLEGKPGAGITRPLCAERFIHAGVFAARPDIKAVIFACSEDVQPFALTQRPLRAMIGPVGDMGLHIPVWDIAKKFGTGTDLTVSTIERARDLARCLGRNRVCLIRGAGFVSTGRSLNDAVRMSVYIPKNARALAAALAFGKVKPLSAGECAARLAIDPDSNAMRRGWEYWANAAGCAHWLRD
jgi:HCOMODA/2-hydroxy-3-carboxy-muconic semialdehyde decarboxylase